MDANTTSTELDYAKSFWSAANAVTAFAILQMIAYLLALGASDSKLKVPVTGVRYEVLAAIVLAWFLYSIIVWLLGTWQVDLLERNGVLSLSARFRLARFVRVVVIGLTSIVGLLITLFIQ